MNSCWLNNLCDAAENYCSAGCEPIPCNWIYRNQSHEYFKDIEDSGGLMIRRLKDNGGDPGSPINGKLSGLFFMAKNNYFGQPQPYSYFGPRRIKIRPNDLFQSESMLYFADFFCMTSNHHYVTLVMTKSGSDSDSFCQRSLIELELDDNPFLFVKNDQWYTSGTSALEIELFWTEDLNIADLQKHGKAHMSTVETRGRGHSTPGGIRKNPDCQTCNVTEQYDDDDDYDDYEGFSIDDDCDFDDNVDCYTDQYDDDDDDDDNYDNDNTFNIDEEYHSDDTDENVSDLIACDDEIFDIDKKNCSDNDDDYDVSDMTDDDYCSFSDIDKEYYDDDDDDALGMIDW